MDHHNPEISLLRDNPAAMILPVQGGGSRSPSSTVQHVWTSSPIKRSVKGSIDLLKATPTELTTFRRRWQNLMMSQHQSSEMTCTVGTINVSDEECPTYVVAPLRGSTDAAVDCISWAAAVLSVRPEAHIVFVGPIRNGAGQGADMIESQIEALSAKHIGQVVCVTDEDLKCGTVDGLVLEAYPKTSKRVGFGFIPDEESVNKRSRRELGCLSVEVVRLDSEKVDSTIMTMKFGKASTEYVPDKATKVQTIVRGHTWNAPPGWITEISFGSSRNKLMRGGEGDAPVAPAAALIKSARASASVAEAPKLAKKDMTPEAAKAAKKVVPPAVPLSIPSEDPVAPPADTPVTPSAPVDSSGTPSVVSTPVDSSGTPSVVSIPAGPIESQEVVLKTEKYQIRKPTEAAIIAWGQGKFTDDERRLLIDNNLIYEQEIYPEYLKVIASDKCRSELETGLGTDCAFLQVLQKRNELRAMRNAQNRLNGMSRGVLPTPSLAEVAPTPSAPTPSAPTPSVAQESIEQQSQQEQVQYQQEFQQVQEAPVLQEESPPQLISSIKATMKKIESLRKSFAEKLDKLFPRWYRADTIIPFLKKYESKENLTDEDKETLKYYNKTYIIIYNKLLFIKQGNILINGIQPRITSLSLDKVFRAKEKRDLDEIKLKNEQTTITLLQDEIALYTRIKEDLKDDPEIVSDVEDLLKLKVQEKTESETNVTELQTAYDESVKAYDTEFNKPTTMSQRLFSFTRNARVRTGAEKIIKLETELSATDEKIKGLDLTVPKSKDILKSLKEKQSILRQKVKDARKNKNVANLADTRKKPAPAAPANDNNEIIPELTETLEDTKVPEVPSSAAPYNNSVSVPSSTEVKTPPTEVSRLPPATLSVLPAVTESGSEISELINESPPRRRASVSNLPPTPPQTRTQIRRASIGGTRKKRKA